MINYKDLADDDVQREGIRAIVESFSDAIHLTVTNEQLDERIFDSKMVILESLSASITGSLKQKGALTREDRLKMITFLDKINSYKDAITWHTMSDSEREGVMKAADRMDKKAQSAFGTV